MKGKQSKSGSGGVGDLTLGKPSTSNPGEEQVLDNALESNSRLWARLLEAQKENRALKINVQQARSAAADQTAVVRSQATSIENLRDEKVRRQALDASQGSQGMAPRCIVHFCRTWRLN